MDVNEDVDARRASEIDAVTERRRRMLDKSFIVIIVMV